MPVVRNNGSSFKESPGNPMDFFHRAHTRIDRTTNPNPTSFDLKPAGVSLSGFTISDSVITFEVSCSQNVQPANRSPLTK